MISDRRDEAISHSHDGVRDEYIKHFRHIHVADCRPRFARNKSNQLGHRQPRFCRVGRFMHYLEPLSTSCMSRLRPGAVPLLFHGQPLRGTECLGAGGVRHGARELGTPRAGGLGKFQTRT